MLDVSTLPDKAPDFDLQELFGAGMHYGHHKSKWHPRMSQFIHSEKDGVHLIDLVKTAGQLRLAYNLLFKLGTEKKPVIIVATKRQAREFAKSFGEEAGMLYITSRWLGGLMTNWSQVKKSISEMVETEKKLAEGTLKGRTKYELGKIEKDVIRAKRFFDGIRSLTDLPGCVIVVDSNREKNAVAEAGKMGVPVIGLVDTNSNPDRIDIAVPGNDDAGKSIELFLKIVSDAYKAGTQEGTGQSKAREAEVKQEVVVAPTPEKKEVAVAPAPEKKEVAAVAEAPAKPEPAQVSIASQEVKKAPVTTKEKIEETPISKEQKVEAKVPVAKKQKKATVAKAEKSDEKASKPKPKTKKVATTKKG